MFLIGLLASSIAKIISDTFTRTTTGGLGSSDTGAPWSGTSWYANGTQAQSDTAATSYPVATVNFGSTNATTKAVVSPGTGVTFWVTDANSWWAVTSTQNTTSTCTSGACSGTETYTYQVSNCYNGACSGTCPQTCTIACSCTTTYTTTYVGSRSQCAGDYIPTSGKCTVITTTSNCPGGACSGTYSYNCSYTASCSNQQGTRSCSCTYDNRVKTLYSVNGTVTELYSQTTTDPAQSIKVQTVETANTQLVYVDAYSDTDFTTSVLSTSFYPQPELGRPNSTGLYGIIKGPSTTGQGSTVDNFSVNI